MSKKGFTPKPSTQSHSSSKKRVFFIVMLLFPALLLAVCEGGLRLLGYGPDLSLFVQEEINGRRYYLLNQEVSARYFSTVDFTPNMSPDYFPIEKTDRTFRIFCLGGSTTAGFPYKSGGAFAPFLRDRLRTMFPEKLIEVINLGMTATNSFTVLDIAEDLVHYKPDLLIVYDGHNEFYGALGIASNESLGASRTLTRLYLKLVHFKSFLLLRDAYNSLAGLFAKKSETSSGGTMMERLARGQYIRYASPQYRAALETFKQNLDDLKSLCRKNSIPVLVGSQASNLRDQRPFVSQPAEELSTGQRQMFEFSFTNALASFKKRDYDAAIASLLSALAQDPLRADAHFTIAQCYDSLGRKDDAWREYVRARDFDMLRFRTSTDFNNVIRDAADEATMFFVDIERKFRANSPDSLIGSNLMMEHLHPNSRGVFLLAKEYQWMMHWHKLMASQDEWNARSSISDERLWDERTVTEIDERAARQRVEILTSGWPFTDEDRPLTIPAPDDTLGRIAMQFVHGEFSWEHAHVEAARYYAQRNDVESEAREYRTLMKQLPLNVSPYLFLAKAYLKQGTNDKAASVLVASLDVEKTWFAYKTLGTLAMDMPVASMFFQNALAIAENREQKVETHFLLAQALAESGNNEQAVAHLRETLELNPNYLPAQNLLKQLATNAQ